MPTDVSVIPYYTLFASPLIHPASFFRNGTIRYDEGFRYAQDYALWTSLIGNGYKLSNVKKPVLKYRYSDTQISRSINRDKPNAQKRSFAMRLTI